MKKQTRSYQRSKPHNKIGDKELGWIRGMLELGIPVKRIALALEMSRGHLHEIINQYNLK